MSEQGEIGSVIVEQTTQIPENIEEFSKKVTTELVSPGSRTERERVTDPEIADAKRLFQEMMGKGGQYFNEHPTLAKVIDLRTRKEISHEKWTPTPWDQLEETLPQYDDSFWETYVREERKVLMDQEANFSDDETARRTLFPTILRHTGEILEQKKRIEQLEDQLYTDELTGLKNQKYYKTELPTILTSIIEAKTPAAVFTIDVDRFKEINDTLGHDAGDAVLQEISQILTNGVRDSDIIVRSGGDEFTVLLEDVAVDQAMGIAERLRYSAYKRAVEMKNEGLDVGFSFSIGVSTLTSDAKGPTTPSEFLKQSDIAMYQSKQTRNSVTLFNKDMSMPLPNSTRIKNG